MPSDKPSPFAGLGNFDKQLLRSTQHRENAADKLPEEEKTSPTDASVRARTPSRTRAPIHTTASVPPEVLAPQLHEKHRLASTTFRFRAEELEALDSAFADLKKDNRTISKNDIVRLGLVWVLEDYKKNKGESMLAQVLARK